MNREVWTRGLETSQLAGTKAGVTNNPEMHGLVARSAIAACTRRRFLTLYCAACMKTYPLYLNNEWVLAKPARPVVNPADGKPFARMSTVGRARVAQTLADAHAAFVAWRQLTGKARGEFLVRIATEVERRRDEIARQRLRL